MKKIAALLLALFTVLSLTLVGCGSKDEEEILGKWQWDMDLADYIMKLVGMDETDNDSKLNIPIILEFKSDGNYEMSVDEAQFETNYNNFLGSFKAVMIDFMYDSMIEALGEEGKGMSREELSEAYKEEAGVTIEDYIDNVMEENMNFDVVKDSMKDANTTGKYKVDGNIIDLDSDRCTFEINGDKMTLDTEDVDDLPEFMTFPATLIRK